MHSSVEHGQHSWRTSPEAVAQRYAKSVYGWDHARGELDMTEVHHAPDHTYRLAARGASDHVVIRAVHPFPHSGIYEVVGTR